MSPHREIELKRLLVGENADERIIAALGEGVAKDAVQTNHLFDTDDRALRRARHTMRLRKEEDEAFLTAKGPTRRVGRDTGSKVEAEVAIDRALAEDLLAERADPLDTLRSLLPDPAYVPLWRDLEHARAGRALRPCGRFENRRRVVPAQLPSGLAVAVEIDRTQFPNGAVDYEVEIELPDEQAVAEAERWLDELARGAGVETKPAPPKTARFYASQSSTQP